MNVLKSMHLQGGLSWSRRLLLLLVATGCFACFGGQVFADDDASATNKSSDATKPGRYHEMIRSHFDRFLAVGTDKYGEDKNAMWLASVDLRDGGQNENIDNKSRRVYRRIHAPRGSNLYWDVPLLVSAYTLSERIGDDQAASGADACIDAFHKRCVSDVNGLYLWGNHVWYHVFEDRFEHIGHGSFEARPISIPWQAFYKHDPKIAENCIRGMGQFHVIDKETGFFDRHAPTDKKTYEPTAERIESFYPFIESGAIIVESLCWLANQDPEDKEQLIDLAKAVSEFCAKHHGQQTGIVRNQANRDRWDYHHGTTEVGMWAGCLLYATQLTGDDSFAQIAEPGLLAYLKYGWDPEAGKYYGAVNVEDGSPQPPQGEDPYPYQPDYYSDVWEPLFPIHDYPMAMAETCISFYERTNKQEYREAIDRWAEHIRNSMPARFLSERHGGEWVDGAYADDYGRCIHFLSRASKVLDKPEYKELAQQLAEEAVDKLYMSDVGAFRSHPGDDTADSVDGLGTLFLALMELEAGSDSDMMGFHF